MPVYSGSRYLLNGRILELEGIEVRRVLMRNITLNPEKLKEFEEYVVRDGDRFDTLAARFGGDATKWWIIAEVNDFVGFPLDLVPGTRLRIPPKSFFEEVTL